ncbi:MAG: protein kinase [Archangiaceae bacterium]|nr:protein kinase [Archangiaceae bacterium]
MISCPSEQRLSAFVEGVLPLAEAKAVQEHLQACDACRLIADLLQADPQSTASSTSAEASLKPGQRIGPYLVLEWLGAGGMGAVWAAHDTRLDRRVALKVLEGPQRTTVMHEARALARLNHPNVATIYDVGELAGVSFLAMELLPGGTLREWLGERPRTLEELLDVFAAVARGLGHAHANGLVHRDFKPDNVLFMGDGTPRVADFGLATLAPDPALASRRMEEVAGTPAYLSPEALTGAAPTAKSDQYAFGVTLGNALERLGRPAPRSVRALVARMAAKDPALRFDSMHDIETALLKARPSARRRRTVRASIAAAVSVAALAWFARERRCAHAGDAAELTWARLAPRLDATFGAEVKRQLDLWSAQSALACNSGAQVRTRCLDEELRRFDALDLTMGVPERISALEVLPSTRGCDFATPADGDAWEEELRRRGPLLERLASAQSLEALDALQDDVKPELDRTAWAFTLSARVSREWSDPTVCGPKTLEGLQSLISASRRAALTALETRAWTDLARCQRQRGAVREAGFSLVVADEVVHALPNEALAKKLTALRRGSLLIHLSRLDDSQRALGSVLPGSGWLEGMRLSRIALLALAKQNAGDAIAAYEKAVPLLDQTFGPNNWESRAARHNLASSYAAAFRYAEALTLLAPDKDTPITTPLASDLVPVLLALGRNQEALVWGRKSLEGVALNDLRTITSMGQQLQAWATAELAAGDKREVLKRLKALRELEALSDSREQHQVERRALEAMALVAVGRDEPAQARELAAQAEELLAQVELSAKSAAPEGRQLWVKARVETLVALERVTEAEALLTALPLDLTAGLDPLERADAWVQVARSLETHGQKARGEALMSEVRPFAGSLGPRARRLFDPS